MSPFGLNDEPSPNGSNLWAQHAVVPTDDGDHSEADDSVARLTKLAKGGNSSAMLGRGQSGAMLGRSKSSSVAVQSLKSVPDHSSSETPSHGHRMALAGNGTRLLEDLKAIRKSIIPGQADPNGVVNHNLFADVTEMKKKIKESVHKPKYDVHNYYKDVGWVQAVVRNAAFDQIGLLVIAANALWIAYDTDYNTSSVLIKAKVQFQIAENFFCAFFLCEWIFRFCAFQYKMNCLRDAWLVFDGTLVVVMVLETWAVTLMFLATGISTAQGVGDTSLLKLVRLVRLVRMARMARLLKAIPELMILIKGMKAATRSVFFTLCLLVIIIYIFGIGFTQLTADTFVGEKYFKDVPAAILTLLLRGTYLDEITELVDDMKEESGGWFLICIFLFFVLLAAHTVVNMLIGVLCEVVSVVATTEKEELMVNFVASKLSGILDEMDKNHNHLISKAEFVKMLENPEASRTLQDIGVDAVGLVDFADVIFPPNQNTLQSEQDDCMQLTFEDFMDVVLQFRGTNTATVKDLVEWQKTVRNAIHLLGKEIKKLEEVIKGNSSFENGDLSKASSPLPPRRLGTSIISNSAVASMGVPANTLANTLRSSPTSGNLGKQNLQSSNQKPFGSNFEGDQPVKPLNKGVVNTALPERTSRDKVCLHEAMSGLLTTLDGVMADPEGMDWVMSRVTAHIRSETAKRVIAEDSLKKLKGELAALQSEVRRLRPPPPPGGSPHTFSQCATESGHSMPVSADVIGQSCQSDLHNGSGSASGHEVDKSMLQCQSQVSQRLESEVSSYPFTRLVDFDQTMSVDQNLAGLQSSLADLQSGSDDELPAVVDAVGHGLPGALENMESQVLPNSSRTHGADQRHGSRQSSDPASPSSTRYRTDTSGSDAEIRARELR